MTAYGSTQITRQGTWILNSTNPNPNPNPNFTTPTKEPGFLHPNTAFTHYNSAFYTKKSTFAICLGFPRFLKYIVQLGKLHVKIIFFWEKN